MTNSVRVASVLFEDDTTNMGIQGDLGERVNVRKKVLKYGGRKEQ